MKARTRTAILEVLVENSQDQLVYLDRDFNFVRVNRAYAETCRRAPEDFVGRNHFELYPHAENQAIFERVRDTGEPAVWREKPFVFPDQPERGVTYWDWTLTPIKDDDGRVEGLVFSLRDVTANVVARQRIKESEERLQLAQLAGNVGGWEWRPAEGELFWADALWEMYGLAPNSVPCTHDLWLSRIHPEDRAAAYEALAESLAHADAGAVDFRIVRPTEEIRWLSSRWRVYRDHAGKALRAVGIEVDLTDLTLAEAARERSRERVQRLVDISARVVRETSPDSLVQVVADAARELTGARVAACGHGHVTGQFVISAASRAPGAPACLPGHAFNVARGGIYMEVVEGREAVRYTDQELRAHPRWWGLPEGHVPLRGLLGVPLVARDGSTSGMILVTDREEGDFTAEDESLLRQLGAIASLALQHIEARLRLEEADRNKDQFLAMLSHELRNPLAPIRNSLYILDRAVPGGEQARRAKSIIDRQVRHMARLIDDLLDVTRISRGKFELQREAVDLRELVLRTIEDHRPVFVANGIELGIAVGDEPLRVSGDPTRLAQAVGNLLSNAAKFTPRGGRTRVALHRDAQAAEAVIRVADTGGGMAADMLSRLFEPFVQADRSLDRNRGGLGLGLTLVKRLVEMHGGSVSARSDGLGKGAEFAIRLPLDEAATAAVATAAKPLRSMPRRVLVIEDNVDAAQSLREALEIGEHRVAVAHDGPEGLERAREFKPEIVLCDIGLAGMDGYEVARAFRRDRALGDTYLVALTGYALPEDLARAKEAGFDEHLAKPPSVETLERVLASVPPPASGPGDP